MSKDMKIDSIADWCVKSGNSTPVPISKFHEHVKKKSEQKGHGYDGFDQDMELLHHVSGYFMGRLYNPPVSVMKKNRYINVLPYESTRVKLQHLDSNPDTEYINASHLALGLLPGQKRSYIAAQAPVPSTMEDWWRMIWEHDVQLVVMVTKSREKDRIIAHDYWPDAKHDMKAGEIAVSCTSCTHDKDVYTRHLTIKKGTETRECIQLQYVGWPDFGVPSDFSTFLPFFQTYREHRSKTTGPIILHCSAGIGRTGTFAAVELALDSVDKTLRQEGDSEPTIDLFHIVSLLRDQRPGMVQTKAQYQFCYAFLDHCISNKLFGC